MTTSSQHPETLAELRGKIDEVDRQIIELLAARNDIVTDIAQCKRGDRTPIRDPQRERQLISDRRDWANKKNLSGDFLESLYRLILWGSRDRQASLKAELPLTTEPRKVAIVGGCGAMGTCIARLFSDLGHEVLIADVDTALTPAQAAASADVVIISVPIEDTVKVIHDIGPLVRESSLLMDVTSIKTQPVEAMLSVTNASVIGTHPLFGPTVHSLQGQRVVLTKGRGDAWLSWLETMLHARGLVTIQASPRRHDEAMAIVQVLMHFSTEVMGMTLGALDVSIQETLTFTSPIYMMEMLMTGRHFAQSPRLYSAIQMNNDLTPKIAQAFIESAKQLTDVVTRKDAAAFEKIFEKVKENFGSFTQDALEQSSFLIDRMVERT